MRLSLLIITSTVVPVLFGCALAEREEPVPDTIRDLVTRLESAELADRKAAVDDLQRMVDKGLTPAESRAILREAGRVYPPLEDEWQDIGAELVEAAAEEPRSDHVGIIRSHFESYSPSARSAALDLLARLPGKKAARTYVDLFPFAVEDLTYLPSGNLDSQPRSCDVYLPALLPHLANEEIQWGICEVCLACLQDGAPSDATMAEIATAMAPLARQHRDVLMPLQEDTGIAWMRDEQYQESRGIAALVLDILGHAPGPASVEEVTAALEYSDPRLKLFGVVGALRNELPVPDAAIETVAASAEVRNWFFQILSEIGREYLFPGRFMTQEAFAESDMVHWLVFPTELATVPDEIELMEMIGWELDEGMGDFFLFRFRTHPPHWAAEQGWLAGISGPFLREEAPTTEAYGGTFSRFEAWDSRTPEGHLQAITGLLEESRELRKGE